jgi:catechol 2,3-dioxygenase-like lactoylglutathione lyase family enzyme
MQLTEVRLLVKDFDKCLKFYTEKLGLERLYNTPDYEGFKVSNGILSIFVSDYMAMVVGNAGKSQPTTDYREKSELMFEVECVDTTYEALKAKGVTIDKEPSEDFGMRNIWVRDPEDNIILFYTMLECEGEKRKEMNFDGAVLMVEDYEKTLKFYTEKLGFEKTYEEGGFAVFKTADNFDLCAFKSDLNAEVVGNADKPLPTNCREKLMLAFETECVDTTYETLKAKGIEFINEPFDWKDAYMRAVHFRDTEGNLIEIHAALACEEGCDCC